MNKNILKYVLLFVVAILIQVFIMNVMQFSRFVNPYFYILFILLLPAGIQRYWLLLLGFATGLTVDMFSNTLGVHASASVLIAFIRPFLIPTLNFDDQEKSISPTILNLGFSPFFKYAAILTLIHHFFLFYVEVFSFVGFFQTFLRSLFSSIFTFVFIITSQFLIFRK